MTIVKRKGDPDFAYEEEVMTLKKGQADETTKGEIPPDEYEEVTVRPEPDTGRLKEVEDETGRSQVFMDYIRKPEKPNWGYVVVNEQALYDAATAVDFELHKSEENNLSIDEKEEFSAEETESSEIDDEFNQETEEELLDIPTFLRRQAN